jgi:hypothetical protein
MEFLLGKCLSLVLFLKFFCFKHHPSHIENFFNLFKSQRFEGWGSSSSSSQSGNSLVCRIQQNKSFPLYLMTKEDLYFEPS